MREILFRGMRTYNKEWIEGSAVRFDDDKIFIMPEHTNASSMTYAEIFCATGAIVEPYSVGQYTGLTDKKGKKIFEGDIVRFRTKTALFNPLCVRWHKETARFVVSSIYDLRTYPMDERWEYEIIGNVFDSPKLLKGGAENE